VPKMQAAQQKKKHKKLGHSDAVSLFYL